MSNLIVRAEHEVILATNYWQNSVAAKYITNAMRELSKRAGGRGSRIVFKLQYDRGSLKQVLENHYIVPPQEYTAKAVALPAPEEIPYIDLQVMNYHKPMLGTFHCKYMIVDRRIAILQSNNIQDNDNMEMMTHLEGPIVDSLYDMALLSWSKPLEPCLPCHNTPNAMEYEVLAANNIRKGYANENNDPINHKNECSAATRNEALIGIASTEETHSRVSHDLGHRERLQESARALATSGDAEHILRLHEHERQHYTQEHQTDSTGDEPTAQHDPRSPTKEKPMNQRGVGPDDASITYFKSGHLDSAQSQVHTPGSTDLLFLEHTSDDPHYDDNVLDEVSRVQTAVSSSSGRTNIQAINRHLNHTQNPGFPSTAGDPDKCDKMIPYILHDASRSFPIALVNREPYGAPNHQSVYNPQNEAWLSAIRNAEKNVFIQTPTLNAEPLIPAIIEACERGIDVICYVCLGYNDAGELLPMQNGTNEMIAHHLYKTLSAVAKKRLHYFWYVARDQIFPIVAKYKKRACHIKLMIVDEKIGIQGNGNQDTQSWFHSQEINVLLESESVCKAWIEGLRRNQNTLHYGMLSKEDGIWRDIEGKEAAGVIGVDPGRFSWMKGVVGAIERVRGTGGF